ncbi:TIGR03617 family F420-dependent LLM class oxidoreductase [Nocardioides sp. AE5]|uniref:TIGR03617 family F420-dependent LLM class oxidoreductase n=1 Tax=Nocardioides sp. AE5 TaxID=2962573 RepID=UPI002881D262|nr:TIGR03617 family F420-dependent LLM class oxidoreductase [Nocardioides sp. AE5]MDT0203217.1 TIGR03617 family F420-dependent LLM class oxidoreductase [Nocardioides sp. AE5]
MQIEVQLDAAPAAARERAEWLVACGVDGLFTFEGAHDVFLPLGQAASTGVDLMTNVAIALPRSPLHLAHAAYDLQLLSGGRFSLGLGSQIRPHIENRYGATWSRPAARMRESVLAVKAILHAWQHGTRLAFEGEFTRHTLMAAAFDPGPNPHGVPPILMGALGPVMTRTAAEVADGLLVMPFNSARHFEERTLPAVREGLARAAREEGDFQVIPQIIAGVGTTEAELGPARDGVRRLLAFYGSTPAYLPVLDAEGRADLQPELNRLSKVGGVDGMAALVDDEMVAAMAVVGTPEECAAKIVERFGHVAQKVCVYFPGQQITADNLSRLAKALHALPGGSLG